MPAIAYNYNNICNKTRNDLRTSSATAHDDDNATSIWSAEEMQDAKFQCNCNFTERINDSYRILPKTGLLIMAHTIKPLFNQPLVIDDPPDIDRIRGNVKVNGEALNDLWETKNTQQWDGVSSAKVNT